MTHNALIYRIWVIFFLFPIWAYTSSCKSFSINLFSSKTYELRFSAVGDIMVHEAQLKSAFQKDCNCYNFEKPFEEIKPILRESDFVIGNLETTIVADKSKPTGYPSFGSPYSLLSSLKNSGFNLIVTANNHCLDKGKSGIENTIRALDREKIFHTGTFSTTSTNRNPINLLIIEKNNIRFALLNYTQFVNSSSIPKGIEINFINKSKILKDIQSAKHYQCDFIIVYFHFGNEYDRTPNDYQKAMVEFAFLNGADIVLGSHPHVLQKFEFITRNVSGKKPRYNLANYSLGNFISGQFYKHTTGGLIFQFSLKKIISRENKPLLKIDDISYSPIWVFRDTQKSPESFHLLPIQKYLYKKGNLILNQKSKAEMNEFYIDTISHLGKKYLSQK